MVKWDSLSDDAVTGYTVHYCVRDNCADTSNDVSIDTRDASELSITGLEDNRHYVASVVANVASPKVDSKKSTPVSFINSNFSPVVSGNNILEWDTTSDLVEYIRNDDGEISKVMNETMYLVHYCDSDDECGDGSSDWKPLSVLGNKADLNSLRENRNYKIRMISILESHIYSDGISDSVTDIDSSLWKEYDINTEESSDNNTRLALKNSTSNTIKFESNFGINDEEDIRYCKYSGDDCSGWLTGALVKDDSVSSASYTVGDNSYTADHPGDVYTIHHLDPSSVYKVAVKDDNGKWQYLDDVNTKSDMLANQASLNSLQYSEGELDVNIDVLLDFGSDGVDFGSTVTVSVCNAEEERC